MRISTLCPVLGAIALACAGAHDAVAQDAQSNLVTELYVSPAGNDAWSGKLSSPSADGRDGPFATLGGARAALRRMRTDGAIEGPVDVLVREGVYRTTTPIEFTPEDSGTVHAPVRYRNYPGERAVVSGGRPVTDWRQEDHLWVADLPEVAAGEWRFSALWVDGEYRRPARMPNEGFLETAGRLPEAHSHEIPEGVDPAKIGFSFNPGDLQRWRNLEDVLVVVMHSWDTTHDRIVSIDEDTHSVMFARPTYWEYERWGPNQRYYVEHVFEGLDQPGEWYLDRPEGRLYYWPMDGESPETTEVIAPVAGSLVQFSGSLEDGPRVEHIHLEGLSFQHTDHSLGPEGMGNHQAAYPVPGAIEALGARHCSVTACEIANVSGYGIWFKHGCQDNRFTRNHIHHMGAGGVRIGEGSQPASDAATALRNVADNNWIHHGGLMYPAAVGVWIGRASYNTVAHNEISDLFYTGVSVGWSWGYAESSANHNIIEFNHIHHIGKGLLSDMGGIYCLGIAPGTVLRNNLIHDVWSYAYGGWGIYPDEGSTDLLIEDNVVYNTKTGGFHQHYGRMNRVRNNIFAFAHEEQLIRTRNEDHISFMLERNIVYYNNGRLLGHSWRNGNYMLDYNCYWDASGAPVTFEGASFKEWQDRGYDVNSIIADPGFVDPENFDFRLKPDSPAITKLGFRPIDINRGGLYGELGWTDGPNHIERAPGEEFPW